MVKLKTSSHRKTQTGNNKKCKWKNRRRFINNLKSIFSKWCCDKIAQSRHRQKKKQYSSLLTVQGDLKKRTPNSDACHCLNYPSYQMKIKTQLLYYILNIMLKHDGDQPILVYSRAFSRDDHHLAPCISWGSARSCPMTSLPTDRVQFRFACAQGSPGPSLTSRKEVLSEILDTCLCADHAVPLGLFKNNRLLNCLAPQVFSHCCDAQKVACKKLALYASFEPSRKRPQVKH